MIKESSNKLIPLAILIGCFCNAQTSNFIVSTNRDTIYVDKISLTDFEVKTTTANKKKKYEMEAITSYYSMKENKHYERITLEQKVCKEPNRYDRKGNEDLDVAHYSKVPKYKYIQRLTSGKVKLFREVVNEGGVALMGSPGVNAPFQTGVGMPGQMGYAAPTETEIYSIAIHDSKLEVINHVEGFKVFDFRKGLELNKAVYDILKIYLYNNTEVNVKLDRLFVSKPIAKEQQIIDLINEYNLWSKLNK